MKTPQQIAAIAEEEKIPRAPMHMNISGDTCEVCGAKEVSANTPRTVYACGSSDYDKRPNSFIQGKDCRQPTDKSLDASQLAFDAYHEIAALPMMHTDAVSDIIERTILTYTASLQQRYNEKHDAFEKAMANYEAAHAINVRLRKENKELNDLCNIDSALVERDDLRAVSAQLRKELEEVKEETEKFVTAYADACDQITALRKNQSK